MASDGPDKLEVLNFLLLTLLRHLFADNPELKERMAQYIEQLESDEHDPRQQRNARAAAEVVRAFPITDPNKFRPH